MLRYMTDRARPGLVALYDIRPGNGAGQFLQPRSPHGANSRLSHGRQTRHRAFPSAAAVLWGARVRSERVLARNIWQRKSESVNLG